MVVGPITFCMPEVKMPVETLSRVVNLEICGIPTAYMCLQPQRASWFLGSTHSMWTLKVHVYWLKVAFLALVSSQIWSCSVPQYCQAKTCGIH